MVEYFHFVDATNDMENLDEKNHIIQEDTILLFHCHDLPMYKAEILKNITIVSQITWKIEDPSC